MQWTGFPILVSILSLLTVSPSLGSQTPQTGDSATTQAGEARPNTAASVEIVNAWCEELVDENAPCFVYHSLVVQVKNLEALAGSPEWNPDQLLLVLNGIVLPGKLFGRRFEHPSGNGDQLLRFDLDKSRETARQEWKELMGGVKGFEPVRMSLGLASATEPTGQAVGTKRLFWKTGTLPIQATSGLWFTTALVAYACLLVFFVGLSRQSYILRGEPGPDGRRPFSLGRVQMAWWFFIAIGSYLYIFIILGDYNTLTPGVLTLIGISAATGFAGATLDASKKADAAEKAEGKTILAKESQDLTTALTALDIQISASPPPANLAQLQAERTLKQQRVDDISARLAQLATPAGATKQVTKGMGLILDILREGDGISFHRFQIAVWSVILGIVFLVSVWTDLVMPEFDGTLLGLMGISSGTYVGFKFPSAGGSDEPGG